MAFAVGIAAVLGGVPATRVPQQRAHSLAARSPFGAAALGLEGLPAALRTKLAESPHAYFRFVNKPWTQAVCDEYRSDAASLPQVRLHGDAHVEQYAVTADSRGLDDFDDSAMGPGVVDIVRFLGSLHLVALQKGWQVQAPRFVDAFFRGYLHALGDPGYSPVEPAIAARLRKKQPRTQEQFLAWADSLMSVGAPDTMEVLKRAIAGLRSSALEQTPELSDEYVTLKKWGVLQMGIGSALTPKVLMRVEGPTPAADDDTIIEAKELVRLDSASCVSIPPPIEAFRVVDAASQLGRLHHTLLVVVPRAEPDATSSPGWWVRSWDPSYRELEIADIRTPEDLLEVAEDAGAQLGAANTRDGPERERQDDRRRERVGVDRLQWKIRRTAVRLTAEVHEAWRVLQASSR
jgi:hypothetical protein